MRSLDRFVDTRPLRSSPAFRRLWIGTTAAAFGGQVAVVAVLYQVWNLTGSTVWTGAIGIATAVPTIVGGIVGGTLADTLDRRRLVLVTTTVSVLAALSLALQAVAGAATVLLVLVLVAAQTSAAAVGAAARRTFISRLLPSDLVRAGVALNHIGFQIAMLTGPAVAGVVLAAGGLRAAYLTDAVGLTVSLYGVLRLPAIRPQSLADTGTARAARGGLPAVRATWEGWRYLLRRPVLRGCLATDLAATVLAMPIALFPAINAQRFDGEEATLGLFLSAIAVGGLLAGFTSGTLTRARRTGRVMLIAAATWGTSLTTFALVDSLPATLACLAVAGAADTVAVISRGTIVQLSTPDAFLGRVSAAEGTVGVAGPGLGNARAGAVAGVTSTAVSSLTGGLACVLAVAVIAATTPALRRWTPPAPPSTPAT
ncbi:MFS transporter [Kineococcus radiotolerans]|uniref:Major facilitator superfamily MFS_1 n=1 Tax=Kineococcus radiotolerans (strain ATCC BAA-149 / DSM 14245 / SRS30216) TaxID=266940 RepID=A6WAJ7_KINRD|nr:MFS transporter [Kineococcus radiotolerans]ABS03836.1 major facilitator superfamily MFS_1 [Kineococcus radiotolerans SRS30216 = ATCC BAA-149]